MIKKIGILSLSITLLGFGCQRAPQPSTAAPTTLPKTVVSTSSIEKEKSDKQAAINYQIIQKAAAVDSDFDGIPNDQENKLGTNPNKADTDGDGVLDGDENKLFKTDPLKADTDGDGLSDGQEIKSGHNPLGK